MSIKSPVEGAATCHEETLIGVLGSVKQVFLQAIYFHKFRVNIITTKIKICEFVQF
jgi:hypothetical protein